MFLFSVTCSLGPSSSWLSFSSTVGHGKHDWISGSGLTENAGVMYRYCRCPSVLTSREYNLESTSLWEKKYQFSFTISSLLYCGSVVCVVFHGWVYLFPVFFGGPLWYSTLQEADCAYIHSKLLIRSSDVHRSNVHDWQTGGFLCFVLKDSLAPPACVFLLVESREMCEQQSITALQRKPNFREIVFSSAVCPHLAAILQHAVCEATVALCADLHIVGALQQQSLLQVACGLVHVGNAVLAVVSEVLGCFSGQEPQEGQLDCCSVGSRAILSVAELYDRGRGQGIKDWVYRRRNDLKCCFAKVHSHGILRSWSLRTRRACGPCSCWSTSSSVVPWRCLGRRRSLLSPCYRRLLWHRLCCQCWDQPSSHLERWEE